MYFMDGGELKHSNQAAYCIFFLVYNTHYNKIIKYIHYEQDLPCVLYLGILCVLFKWCLIKLFAAMYYILIYYCLYTLERSTYLKNTN